MYSVDLNTSGVSNVNYKFIDTRRHALAELTSRVSVTIGVQL